MLVTIEEFNAYSGNYEADTAIVNQKNMVIASAQNIVADFLRYDPEDHVWDEDPEQNVCPQAIKLTILRIATLLLMEAGENIGVTSKSLPDNSKTFINYTSYMKYLRPIQNWRTVVF